MRALTAAALILVFLPSTLQRCHSEHVPKNCRTNDRIWPFCTGYYEIHCYEVTNELKSAHMEFVHKIIVKSGNMTSLTRSLFADFENVRSITITRSNVASVAYSTFLYLIYLESVNLTNNALEVISPGSFNSISLKELDLSNNSISTIEYQDYLSVTELILRHNQFTNISNLVAVCASLKTLDLSYNRVNTIELSEECANLYSLNAAHNELSKFTVTSNQTLVLKILDLSWNNLNDISSMNLCNIVTLSSLNLNNNPLFYAKNPTIDLFQNTLRLEVLNLSSTGIQKIYVGTFSKLSSLEVLDLSQNNLTALPRGIVHDLNSLTQLYLNNNRLKYFYYEGLTKLTKIDLNANLFTCDAPVDIVNILTQKNVDIIHGNTRDTQNIFGISCLDAVEKAKCIISQFDHAEDHQNKECYMFFSKVAQIMQQFLLAQ